MTQEPARAGSSVGNWSFNFLGEGVPDAGGIGGEVGSDEAHATA
jgi:hypothetical protein